MYLHVYTSTIFSFLCDEGRRRIAPGSWIRTGRLSVCPTITQQWCGGCGWWISKTAADRGVRVSTTTHRTLYTTYISYISTIIIIYLIYIYIIELSFSSLTHPS